MKHLDYIYEVPRNADCGTEDRSIYLTFDDGPNPHCTPEILDVLAEYGVPATFSSSAHMRKTGRNLSDVSSRKVTKWLTTR